ncbi:NADP-dependent leukotriene B4 12-hydroxydehydrogenase [Metarhizium album ARSEF 1941]|uniref:Dehydrogenase FUB6 n=1 Tax=Metarhizium album (strain ARSEF 1941) TaxID=1081103 RepID=A0A0B2X7Q0_METAS|nr:NADP-dependent leukotriene B4 12-hydroxydehydrogenase [Metarhizium album ARSEF 1941]KHO01301.1 NADP-dependent leukotriene B4 12-hydroxydehydrogenase [Metarhizium album ARSEF 1941]
MVPNKTLVYKQVPKGLPVPGKDLVVETRDMDLEEPPKGGLIVEILYASLDPYLRPKMRDPSIESYSPAFVPNNPIENDTVGRVLKSDSPDFKPGDIVKAHAPIAEYAALADVKGLVKVHNPHNLDLSLFTGALGMPGLTAWSSLHRIGKPKRGETIFVSSAAGAVGQLVGQLVGQIAKKEGLKVIGSVGSDEKLDFITEQLGFDAGFNYKKERPGDALKRLAPDGIDIYYENVGGEHLEAALDSLNDFGRVVACGMVGFLPAPWAAPWALGGQRLNDAHVQISQYNIEGQAYGVRNLMLVVTKQLTVQGFIVTNPDFGPAYYQEHQEKLQQWLADGSVQAKMSYTEGIDHAAEGLVGIFEGKNFGKAVLRIKA